MKDIALFPLKLFMLPGDYTQLYIFEDRFQQLIRECALDDTTFGIPFSHKLNDANMGTEVQLAEIIRTYPDGEMDVLVKAVDVFVLEQFVYQQDDKLYPGGNVAPQGLAYVPEASPLLLAKFKKHLLAHKSFDSELLARESLNLFEIANALQMNDLEKLQLLQQSGEDSMEYFLVNYLRYLELLHEQESHLYHNIYLN